METSGPRPAPQPLLIKETPGGRSALLECLECGTQFWTREKHVGRRRYCSLECRRIGYPKDHGNHKSPEQRRRDKAKRDREYVRRNRKRINARERRARREKTTEQREKERLRSKRYYEARKAKQPPKEKGVITPKARKRMREGGRKGGRAPSHHSREFMRALNKKRWEEWRNNPNRPKLPKRELSEQEKQRMRELAKKGGEASGRQNRIRKTRRMIAMASNTQLTPKQAAQLRTEVYKFVQNQLVDANDVVLGAKEWSPTQARVFGMLLNKVIPDVNASFVQHEHTTKSLRELSREELEAIAQGESEVTVEAEVISNDSP